MRRRIAGGSIPACAGEPCWGSVGQCSGRVYPRVCGGTLDFQSPEHTGEGLSPRVRGNRRVKLRWNRSHGSIPACAGEPSRASILPPMATVYPRVCGGTALLAGQAEGDKPSIPACAGEPRWHRRRTRRMGVYPRVCGGTPTRAGAGAGVGGLSPRVRGNPLDPLHLVLGQRSIPACAGEPAQTATRCRSGSVYPRVCGGTNSGIRAS